MITLPSQLIGTSWFFISRDPYSSSLHETGSLESIGVDGPAYLTPTNQDCRHLIQNIWWADLCNGKGKDWLFFPTKLSAITHLLEREKVLLSESEFLVECHQARIEELTAQMEDELTKQVNT